jgi:hypothetical protein
VRRGSRTPPCIPKSTISKDSFIERRRIIDFGEILVERFPRGCKLQWRQSPSLVRTPPCIPETARPDRLLPLLVLGDLADSLPVLEGGFVLGDRLGLGLLS